MDIRGNDLSVLIGRRSETLSAFQYIASLIVGKEEQQFVQLTVDVEGYRDRREKQLIQILTGVEVPSGGLPADIGILCQNVGTCTAIHDAVVLGRPLISRITTLTGEALAPAEPFLAQPPSVPGAPGIPADR